MSTSSRLPQVGPHAALLARATGSIVWTASADGRFGPAETAWAEFTGRAAEECRGWGWIAAIHPAEQAGVRQALGGTATALEIGHRLRRHDGAWRDTVLHATRVPASGDDAPGDDAPGGWAGVHVDRTAAREAAEELAAALEEAADANRARSQFLAGISHEIRIPLSAVIGYSELVAEEIHESGPAHLIEDLHRIRDNACDVLAIINDVLDVARLQSDRMAVQPSAFEAATLVQEVTGAAGGILARRHNALEVQCAEMGVLRTDRSKLRQCLLNLIDNAARSSDGHAIGLSAWRERRAQADWAVFAVRDSGVGMTAQQVAALFQDFAATDPYLNHGAASGLELAVTRGLAVVLGGDLDVASAYGVGTTLTLSVPAQLG